MSDSPAGTPWRKGWMSGAAMPPGTAARPLILGLVGGVDQPAQRIGDLAWPDGIRMGFGRVGKITQ